METLLHGLIILVVLGALISGSRRYLTLGLLAGLSIWVRPDGLTLLGPILFVALLSEKTWHLRGEAIWKTLLGFGALFSPICFLIWRSPVTQCRIRSMPSRLNMAFWLSKPLAERVS